MKIFKLGALALTCWTNPAWAGNHATFNLEHNAYSGGRGSRAIATLDTVVRMSEDTKAVLTIAGGQRHVLGHDSTAVRAGAALGHSWSKRLSTQTSVDLASSGTIFARGVFAQDVSYRLTDSLNATVGARYSAWAGGDRVKTWSAGASYYLPGLSASYRFSLLNSSKLGRSHTHLASLRIKDAGGSGNTQLWLGAGTSLYDVSPDAGIKSGTFKSVTVRREQPIADGIALSAGIGRSWFRSATGDYQATSLMLGFKLVGSQPRLNRSGPNDAVRQ